jgi:hypothetical protein
MAFENLFIRTKKSIGGIELDAVISETHTNQIRLTKNPVELGADITDHAVIEPKKINIIAQVSDTPLGTAAFGQIVDLVTGLFGTSTTQNITRSNAAYNAMVQLMEEREPIEVQTKLKLYQDMVITSLSVTQDKNTSRIVLMNISLEEVLITESQIVKLTPEQLQEGSAREQATSAEKKGRQEPVTPSETTNKSVLKSITSWVGG